LIAFYQPTTFKPDMKTEQELAERSAKRFWVSLVVTLLGLQLVIGYVAIKLATGDPTVAVIPDYHDRALGWDVSHQASTAADRMGWTVDIVASDIVDDRGMRAATVTVWDETGTPVDDLQVVGMAYHHARAGDVQRFDLPSVGEGRYLTLAPLGRPGLWQIEVHINGAEQPMQKSAAIEIPTS
jgi:hypothetical protein